MNTDTLDKMRRLRLLGMHRAFKTSLEASTNETCTADELIAMLIDSEWDDRQNRTIERSLRRVPASVTRLLSSSWNTALKEDWIKMAYTAWQTGPLSKQRKIY